MFQQQQSTGGCCSKSRMRFYNLYRVMGAPFLALIMLVEHVLQAFIAGGGSKGLIGAPILLLLSKTGLQAARIQILETIAVSSWQLKPIIGIISDNFYVGGYNKMPFMIGTALMGIVAAGAITFYYPVSPQLFTVLLFFVFLPIATCDLLLEARYAQRTTHHPDVRPTLQTFIQVGTCFCQLFAISLLGLLIIKNVALEWLYLSPIMPFIFVIIAAYQNWHQETDYQCTDQPLRNLCCRWFWYRGLPDEDQKNVTTGRFPILGINTIKIRDQWRVVTLALLIGFVSLLTSTLGLLELSTGYLFGASIGSSLIMIGAFFLLLERPLAKIQTFVVIQNIFSLSLGAATFFFYTDPVEAYPEGPHFSKQFYVTVMGGVGIVLALIGVATYDAFMVHWSYRKVFLVTNILYILALLPNPILYRRWNRVIGIPDVVFVLGAEAMQVIVAQWNWMPYAIMIMSLCPHGIEASSYAILAATSNIGSAFNNYQGAFVLDMLKIKPTGNMSGESEQFDNLWIASMINISLQVVPLFFLPFLIPNISQSVDLLTELRKVESTYAVNATERDTMNVNNITFELSSDEDSIPKTMTDDNKKQEIDPSLVVITTTTTTPSSIGTDNL